MLCLLLWCWCFQLRLTSLDSFSPSCKCWNSWLKDFYFLTVSTCKSQFCSWFVVPAYLCPGLVNEERRWRLGQDGAARTRLTQTTPGPPLAQTSHNPWRPDLPTLIYRRWRERKKNKWIEISGGNTKTHRSTLSPWPSLSQYNQSLSLSIPL